MKNQTHQSPLCPSCCYLAIQIVGIEVINLLLQVSPLKVKLWKNGKTFSGSIILGVQLSTGTSPTKAGLDPSPGAL